MKLCINRRRFLETAGVVGAGIGFATLSGTGLLAGERASTAPNLARLEQGLDCQMYDFNVHCPSVGLNDKDPIRDLAAAFAKRDAVFAEAERWHDLLDVEVAHRAAKLATVDEVGLPQPRCVELEPCFPIIASDSRYSRR